MPNLSDGAVDAVWQRDTRFGLLPVLATVAGAVLAVAVLLSGYNMITAPIGSLETQTPAPTAAMSPFPTTEPTATATVEPTPLPGGVPVEVTERAELPSCGHEVVAPIPANGTWIDSYDVEARECFLAAYEAGEPAEFITDAHTLPDGGPRQTIYRLLPSGEIEIFTDTTQDPYSDPGWYRRVCLSIRADDQYGVLFDGDECDESVLISSGVPVEVAERAELPACGHEVVTRPFRADGTWIDVFDVEARECFLAAYEAGEPAEFITDGLTNEGGRFREIYRLLPSGEIEIFIDTTQDPMGGRRWARTICLSIRELDPDPSGGPMFIAEECDHSVVISG